MVLAPEGKTRDAAASILHAHGAEFVGFYGRWAYESLSPSAASPAPDADHTYDINIDGASVRITLQERTVMGDSSASPGIRTTIGPGLSMLSWPRAGDTTIVHVVDVDAGIAYASISRGDAPPRHVKGTIVVSRS